MAVPLWFEGLLVLPLFTTLTTKADVIEADSSLFSAVKQRKGHHYGSGASEAARAAVWTHKKIYNQKPQRQGKKMGPVQTAI